MPGSGLGLSIVKQVVDGHNGIVSINNRDGGGTIVRVALPPAGLAPPDVSGSEREAVAQPVR
jgi:signal transduction histidine kinase